MNIYLAKQPIFNLDNNTYGYELLFRNNRAFNRYKSTNGDKSTADVIVNAFFDLNTRDILGGKKAFINFTEELLRRGVPKLLPPGDVVVEILEDVESDGEILGRIREFKDLGYLIALDGFVYKRENRDMFDLGDIIKIDFRKTKEEIERTVRNCERCGKITLAEKVETQAEFEYAKNIGATLIQGFYYAKPTIITKKSISPMTKSFVELVKILGKPEPDIDGIIDIISTDAALVVKLLKLVNSAYFGSKSDVSTIKQAVVMLGLEPLKEWIYLLSMNKLKENKSDELLKMSLMRAKFCQEITEIIPGGKMYTKEMYLMGLISLMHVFSDMSQEELLEQLPISRLIKDGISGTGGVCTSVYELCCSYEAAKWDLVDVYAEKLGIDMSVVSGTYISCAEFVQKFWNTLK